MSPRTARAAEFAAASVGPRLARVSAFVGPRLARVAALASVAAVVALAGCGSDDQSGSGSSTSPSSTSPTTPSTSTTESTSASQGTARPEYVGMVASEALPQLLAEQEATLKAQAAAGVGTLRQTFQWNEIEPRKGDWAFGMHDQLVASAAKAGITILPIVFNVRPGEKAKPKKNVTITRTTTMPPRNMETFAQYAVVLVKRYGRGGSFWKEHPELPPHPMTAWQIWNEPNIKPYWGGRPNQVEYTAMLKATSTAIRAVDPEAEIVTGGIPDSTQGIALPDYLKLLSEAGAKGTFDTLAVHPYSKSVDGVISRTQDARNLLDRYGFTDVNVWITEVGWATSGPRSKFSVSSGRQGELVAELLQRTAAVAKPLKLRGVVYYGWRDQKPYPGGKDFWGLHTGLLTEPGERKPSLTHFRNAAKELQAGG